MTSERGARNKFDIGVMVALAGLMVTILGIAVKGAQKIENMDSRLQSLELRLAAAPPPVDITPGAARAIDALKARQDMDDKLRVELDARLARIEQTQFEILRELRRR